MSKYVSLVMLPIWSRLSLPWPNLFIRLWALCRFTEGLLIQDDLGMDWASLGASGKGPACQCRRCKKHEFDPWVGKIPQRRVWQLTSIFSPGEFHGQRSLVGYSPQGCKESNTTETTQDSCMHDMDFPSVHQVLSTPPTVQPELFIMFQTGIVQREWKFCVSPLEAPHK